jgi:hypothetical protein
MACLLRCAFLLSANGPCSSLIRWQQTCLNVFRREQSNTVKQATFSPIMKLIKLKLHVLDADKLGVKDMCEMYACFFVAPSRLLPSFFRLHTLLHFSLRLIREYISGKASQTGEHAASSGIPCSAETDDSFFLRFGLQ